MPARVVLSISSLNALAVTATMGTHGASARSSARMALAAWQPSISGICISIKMASTE